MIQEVAKTFRVETSPEALVIMLGALKDMSLFRPLAQQITNVGLLGNLIAVIRANLLGSDVLLVSAEILWNVLELDREHATAALGSLDVMESFVVFLVAVFHGGFRYKDKIFRNDMCALLLYLATNHENHQNFLDSGLLILLLKHSAEGAVKETIEAGRLFEDEAESLPSGGSLLLGDGVLAQGAAGPRGAGGRRKEAVPLTSQTEDMEFRILMWRTIANTAVTPGCATLIEKFLLTHQLLGYLDVIQTQKLWSRDQHAKLMQESLSVLFQIGPHCPTSFVEADGNGILIRLLQTTQNRDLQRACLVLLHRATISSSRAEGRSCCTARRSAPRGRRGAPRGWRAEAAAPRDDQLPEGGGVGGPQKLLEGRRISSSRAEG